MTKFNPENKETLTYGETLTPAMSITDPEDAKQYMRSYIEWMQKKAGVDSHEAEMIVKANLSYYTGYYDDETSKRVRRLFNLR